MVKAQSLASRIGRYWTFNRQVLGVVMKIMLSERIVRPCFLPFCTSWRGGHLFQQALAKPVMLTQPWILNL